MSKIQLYSPSKTYSSVSSSSLSDSSVSDALAQLQRAYLTPHAELSVSGTPVETICPLITESDTPSWSPLNKIKHNGLVCFSDNPVEQLKSHNLSDENHCLFLAKIVTSISNNNEIHPRLSSITLRDSKLYSVCRDKLTPINCDAQKRFAVAKNNQSLLFTIYLAIHEISLWSSNKKVTTTKETENSIVDACLDEIFKNPLEYSPYETHSIIKLLSETFASTVRSSLIRRLKTSSSWDLRYAALTLCLPEIAGRSTKPFDALTKYLSRFSSEQCYALLSEEATLLTRDKHKSFFSYLIDVINPEQLPYFWNHIYHLNQKKSISLDKITRDMLRDRVATSEPDQFTLFLSLFLYKVTFDCEASNFRINILSDFVSSMDRYDLEDIRYSLSGLHFVYHKFLHDDNPTPIRVIQDLFFAGKVFCNYITYISILRSNYNVISYLKTCPGFTLNYTLEDCFQVKTGREGWASIRTSDLSEKMSDFLLDCYLTELSQRSTTVTLTDVINDSKFATPTMEPIFSRAIQYLSIGEEKVTINTLAAARRYMRILNKPPLDTLPLLNSSNKKLVARFLKKYCT